MTIKQQGGIFGRNPSFNDLEAEQATVNGKVNIQSNRPQIFLYEQDRTDNNARIECSFDNLNISQVDDSNNNPVARLTIEMDTGDLYVNDGNLVIGTSGKGIDFSATSGTGTSELLDDYEEGTWTPVVTAAAGTITSYSIISSRYTKVGQLIVATTRLSITDAGTGNGNLIITLPFAAGTQDSVGSAYESVLTGDAGRTWITSGGTTMYVAKYNNSTYCVTGYTITATAIYSV